MLRRLSILLLLVFAGATAYAQTDTLPSQIDVALDALSERVGQELTVDDLEEFTFNRQDFPDTSLGCPQPGEVYAEVITPGYQFRLEYDGSTYDYRVSEDEQIVTLCDVETVTQAPGTSPCPSVIIVEQGDTLSEISRRCEVSVEALVNANASIEEATDTIFAGQRITVPGGGDSPVDGTSPNPVVAVYPLNAPAGTPVDVIVNGFPANTEVNIGIGRVNSEYDVVQTATSNGAGALSTRFEMPDFVNPDDEWVIVAETADNSVQANSNVIYATESNLFTQTDIYMIVVAGDGPIGCGDEVVPVGVQIDPTIAPLTAAYEMLLSIDEQQYIGYYNALAGSDLSLDDAAIVDGNATVNLSGELAVGGTCDVPRIEAQLRQTALQYSTVDEVAIFINGQPLEDVLSAQS